MYRTSKKEVMRTQDEYKKNYAPFRPFVVTHEQRIEIGNRTAIVIKTQNGQDTDDYVIDDNNKVEKYLKDFPRGSRILLVGVGTGREVLVAKELGFNAAGITFGSRNLDFGHKYLGLSEEEHFEALAEVLPFQKETFDVVAGFQVFEHTISPLIFLLEQGRVLKYGGTLILEWPPPKSHTYGDNPHHQVCFVPGQAKALLEKAGFTNIRLEYDNGTPIPDSDMWNGDADYMLVVVGEKHPCGKEYVNEFWSL